MTNTRIGTILLALSALTLAGCGSAPASDTGKVSISDHRVSAAAMPDKPNLADALDNADGLQTVAEGLKQTRLKSLFDGTARYTLFAPDDAAFDRLGTAAKALTRTDDFSALTGLLRDHIVAGSFTTQMLSGQIDASADHAVRLRSIGGKTMTFTKSSGGISVSSDSGFQAGFDGTEIAGANSVAIGIDGVLGKV